MIKKIFYPPPSPHRKMALTPPTIKISKITPHRPTGPLPISANHVINSIFVVVPVFGLQRFLELRCTSLYRAALG